MDRTATVIALLLASGLTAGNALAQAPTPVPPCGGPGKVAEHGQAMHHGYRHGAMGEPGDTTRLAALQDALQLQPAQMEAWNDFAARLSAMRGERRAQKEKMLTLRADPDALDDYRVAMLREQARTREQVNAARKALVATLTPAQKATLDAFRREPKNPMQPMGPDGRGHRHGPGPDTQS